MYKGVIMLNLVTGRWFTSWDIRRVHPFALGLVRRCCWCPRVESVLLAADVRIIRRYSPMPL